MCQTAFCLERFSFSLIINVYARNVSQSNTPSFFDEGDKLVSLLSYFSFQLYIMKDGKHTFREKNVPLYTPCLSP